MSGRSGFGSPELTYGFITHSLSVPMNECLSVVYVTASAHLAYTEEYQLHHLESTLVNACMLNLCGGKMGGGKKSCLELRRLML